jgi:hypothetical protein
LREVEHVEEIGAKPIGKIGVKPVKGVVNQPIAKDQKT